MSLKQKIEEAYGKWEKDSENSEWIEPSSSNYETVFDKIKKLKNDLCHFADDFDKSLSNKRTIDANTLNGKTIDDFYENIQKNFVERIAEEDNIFIYGYDKDLKNGNKKSSDQARTEYSDNMKKFNSKYKNLKSDLKKSKNLIAFFAKCSDKFRYAYRYDKWEKDEMDPSVSRLNQDLDRFISRLFKAIHVELLLKEKVLVAKNKDYFYTEKDSNIFSRIIRHIFPSIWSAFAQMNDKHTVEPVKNKEVKIFPQGKPLVTEVKQGGASGDCYLMAALIALAKTNPKAITDCFVQGLDKIENDNKIDIRFFQKTKSKATPITITIDKKRVILPRNIKGNALWPKLIEKAYDVYRKNGYENNSKYMEGKIDDGGTARDVMFAITGKDSRSDISILSKTKIKPENVISKIKTKLQKGRSLTCTFKKDVKIVDVKSGEKIKIYRGHSYAIVGIDETKKYVRLINPWKFSWKIGGRAKRHSPKSNEGGHIAMSYDDFKKYFLVFEYTTGKDLSTPQ